MKCQITTIQPNKGGNQQVWNFTDIKLQDANYELKYEAQGNDTIIATEHRTMYYYQKSGDSLFCIGYENPTTFIKNLNYCLPFLSLKDIPSMIILKVKEIIAIIQIYIYVVKQQLQQTLLEN